MTSFHAKRAGPPFFWFCEKWSAPQREKKKKKPGGCELKREKRHLTSKTKKNT
jgi:hypothetical protein